MSDGGQKTMEEQMPMQEVMPKHEVEREGFWYTNGTTIICAALPIIGMILIAWIKMKGDKKSE